MPPRVARQQGIEYQYDKQAYGGEMGGKEMWSDLCAVVRGSSEEARVVRNGMMRAECLPPGDKSGIGA